MPADAAEIGGMERLLASAPPESAAMLVAAHDIATRAHAGQLRRGGAPYIGHPVEVALILRDQLGVSADEVIAAALLHDAVEDSELHLEDLAGFSARTRELVALLTDWEPRMSPARRREHLGEIWKDPDATLLKAADRLSNLRDVALMPSADARQRYVDRTRAEFLGTGLPLASHPLVTPLLERALQETLEGPALA
ncbi:MAG: HD domain-containing protein [Candidatus Dormiibacterota bacterium]